MVTKLKGNETRVFVLVGPFNTHLIANENLDDFLRLKSAAIKWLEANEIPCFVPETLPTDLYADASHPLLVGYQELSRRLSANQRFQQWLQSSEK